MCRLSRVNRRRVTLDQNQPDPLDSRLFPFVVVKTRRWECDRTGSRSHVLWVHDWGLYHSSEKVSCDKCTGIHRLIYRDICVAATAHNSGVSRRACLIVNGASPSPEVYF